MFLTLVGGAALADGYYQSYRIYKDARGIRPQLLAAREALARGEIPASDPFGAASAIADRAQNHLDGARLTLRLAGAIPFFNRPVIAVRRGVHAAQEEATAASLMQGILSDVLGDSAKVGQKGEGDPSPIFHDGVANVRLVEDLVPRMEQVIGHLRAAQHTIEEIPPFPFVHQIDRMKVEALAESGAAITLANEALSGFRLLPSFLGADEPRTYYLAMQNFSDQRATGGAVLAYSFLTIDQGRPSLSGGGSIQNIDSPRVGFPRAQIPAPVAWFMRQHFRPRVIPRLANINFTPDFPTVARTWTSMLEDATGRRVDGVIAMDPQAIASLLKPGRRTIVVPSYPAPITSKNAVRVIANDQYRLPSAAQRAFPSQLIAAAWRELLNPDSIVPTLRQLGTALSEKHLQIWSSHVKEQELLRNLNWDGALRAGSGDFLYFIDNKLRVNKVDYYSRIAVNYRATILPSGDIRSTASIIFRNTTPPGQPREIAGPWDGDLYGLNRALLGIYVPSGARLESVQPARGPESLPTHAEGVATVFLRVISIPGGETKKVAFSYSVPNAVQMTPAGRLYRLIVQHQPMAYPVALTVTVTLPSGATVQSAPGWTVKGSVATFHTSLTRDLVREIQF